ncbi:MAG: hypothetical protein O3A00_08705 [Planctomycetota bacterium]|nr:hypothetical protein [Planctomycetota bacterium]
MDGYSAEVEQQMGRFYRSLNERDRRRYAGIEAAKLGHGGIEYVSRLLGCDPKTIRQGIAEIESDEELDNHGQRKKGVDVKR